MLHHKPLIPWLISLLLQKAGKRLRICWLHTLKDGKRLRGGGGGGKIVEKWREKVSPALHTQRTALKKVLMIKNDLVVFTRPHHRLTSEKNKNTSWRYRGISCQKNNQNKSFQRVEMFCKTLIYPRGLNAHHLQNQFRSREVCSVPAFVSQSFLNCWTVFWYYHLLPMNQFTCGNFTQVCFLTRAEQQKCIYKSLQFTI